MLVATEYVGHREEEAVAARLAETTPARIVLSDTERRRSRVRTRTMDGTELGVVIARDLADGDVIKADDGMLVVVELEGIEALVLDVGAGDLSPTVALELGHALGNRHWDLALRGEEALFPVATSRERTEATVADVVPGEVPYRFETVPPTTFDDGPGHTVDATHPHTHGGGHVDAHDARTHDHSAQPTTRDEE